MPGRAEGMEKHIAQDCQGVDESAKQEMSQLLMTKRLQVCPNAAILSSRVKSIAGLLTARQRRSCMDLSQTPHQWIAGHHRVWQCRCRTWRRKASSAAQRLQWKPHPLSWRTPITAMPSTSTTDLMVGALSYTLHLQRQHAPQPADAHAYDAFCS